MTAKKLSLAFLFFLLAAATPAVAQNPALSGPEPVDLVADEINYDREQETVTAEGNVRLSKGGLTLLADRVFWRPESGGAQATGNVRLDAPEGTLEGEGIQLNMETGLGHLSQARILLRDGNYRIAGEEIDRLAEERYSIVNGTLTTCDGTPPAWRFTARRMDVTVGGYARARHVLFYLRDLPVLYLPFVAYPVKTERESGFLMPRIGSSSKRGFQLSLAWYQVIDRHLDATFYLDYLSKLGIGKGIEYRYIFGEDTEGTAHAYHISGTGGEKDRYAFDWQHAGALPGEVRLTADIEYVSTRDYFDDFGVVAEEYNQDQAQSVLAVSRHWRRSIFAGQFKYTKDLEADNDQTLQKLPEVVFSAMPQRLGETPFFLALDSAYDYFWRQDGLTGSRFTLRPELSAAFHPGDFLEIRPVLGYRERFYWTSEEETREGIADFSTRVSSRFSRVYVPDSGKISKLRHTIEPELTYRYTPHEKQSGLPQFDALDTLSAQNNITYALVNRLVARLQNPGGEPVYHEYAYLRLSQNYDFRDADSDAPPEATHPYSPLRTELIVRPNRFSYIDLDISYDVNSGAGRVSDRLANVSARVGLQDGVGNGLKLEYQYDPDELSYLGTSIDLALLRPIYLNYQHRHDFDAGEVLEQVLNLEYRAQCWSLFLTFRDRLEETEYLVSFALTGLGKVTELGGRLRGGRE